MRITPALIGVIAASKRRDLNDPYIGNVLVLMHYNNDYVDVKGNTFTNTGTTFSTTAKWGSHAMSVNGTSPGGGGTNGIQSSGLVDFTSGGDFTAECWVRLNNNVATTYAPFIRLSLAGGTEITLSARQNGASPNCLSASYLVGVGSLSTTTSTANLNTGQYYHVALTRDGSTYRMFVDGTLVSTFSASYTPPSGSKLLQIGTVGGFAIDGLIDDVRITTVCRYTASFTAPTAQFPDI